MVLWCVHGKISSSAAIGFGRLAWNTEVADEIFTFFHFLVLKAKYRTGTFK